MAILENYVTVLHQLKIKTADNCIILNDMCIDLSVDNAELLFSMLTEFSISTSEKNMIVMYYGLGDEPPCTLQELSTLYEKSDEAVRLNIKAAMRKVAHRLNKQRVFNRILQEVDAHEYNIKK